MAQLHIRSAKNESIVELGDRTSIGRVLENDVCIQDTLCSRYHAEIVLVGEEYVFRDLDSRNGSYVNKVKISETPLLNGDRIRIGKVTMKFVEELPDTTPSGLVRIASQPVSDKAIQDRIEVAESGAFPPADSIADGMDWREDYEKLRLGNELLQQIGFQRDFDEILGSIADKMLQIFPADRCAILLLNQDTDALVPMAIKARPGVSKHMSISESILLEMRRTHSGLFVADISSDERFASSASILVQGLHSILCAPIIHHNNFYGAIYLDSQKSAMVFSRKDLQLITSLVTHVATIISNMKLLQSVEQEARDRAQLSRLLPPSIMKKVSDGEIKLENKGGELKKVTILFADIRGFTNMAHYAPAKKVVDMLNEYFELVVNVVFEHGGTVDKFIGDEVMVLFGALTDVDFPEERAVRCAFHMHGVLEMFNRDRMSRGEKEIKIGIGINTGDAVVGAIGSSQSMQFTCIGDSVNVAARLTSIAGPGQTIISEETFRNLKVKPRHEKLEPVRLKGIGEPVQYYSVWEQMTDTARQF